MCPEHACPQQQQQRGAAIGFPTGLPPHHLNHPAKRNGIQLLIHDERHRTHVFISTFNMHIFMPGPCLNQRPRFRKNKVQHRSTRVSSSSLPHQRASLRKVGKKAAAKRRPATITRVKGRSNSIRFDSIRLRNTRAILWLPICLERPITKSFQRPP